MKALNGSLTRDRPKVGGGSGERGGKQVFEMLLIRPLRTSSQLRVFAVGSLKVE